MTVRSDGLETRARILEAAAKVFAENGYHDATNAAICELAGVNSASINYHFGTKAALYQAAWGFIVEKAHTLHPTDGGVPPEAPAEERLKGRIRALTRRVSDRGALAALHAIRFQELASPTGLLDEAMRAMHTTNQKATMAVIAELLGPDAEQGDLEMCERSVMSQCFMLKPPGNHPGIELSVRDTDTITEHILRFSLAGIAAARQAIEARKGCRN